MLLGVKQIFVLTLKTNKNEYFKSPNSRLSSSEHPHYSLGKIKGPNAYRNKLSRFLESHCYKRRCNESRQKDLLCRRRWYHKVACVCNQTRWTFFVRLFHLFWESNGIKGSKLYIELKWQ